MRKIFTLILIWIAGSAVAQPYNNEWIDFSKTYYKFKITADGLYRIPASVLASAGLAAGRRQRFINFSQRRRSTHLHICKQWSLVNHMTILNFGGR